MDFINGEIRILYIKRDEVYFPIGCLTSNSFSEGVQMIDTTTRENSNGWKTSRPTNQNYNISFDGLILDNPIVSDKVTYYDLKTFKRGRTLIEWKTSNNSSDDEFGSGYITNLSDSASIDEFISFSGGIEGFGEPINELDSIFNAYKARVEADGGLLTSERCTKTYINSIL